MELILYSTAQPNMESATCCRNLRGNGGSPTFPSQLSMVHGAARCWHCAPASPDAGCVTKPELLTVQSRAHQAILRGQPNLRVVPPRLSLVPHSISCRSWLKARGPSYRS